MASKKIKRSQIKLLNEVKDQLVLQAERWDRTGYYTPVRLQEMELAQCYKIAGELSSERSNLEYELNMLDSDKQELLIKLERLEAYIKKAAGIIRKHEKMITRSIEKLIINKDKLMLIMKKMRPENNISVLVSSN